MSSQPQLRPVKKGRFPVKGDAINSATPFHLADAAWQYVQWIRQETHPDIPFETFTTEVVLKEQPVTGQFRDDPTCESGQRSIEYVLQTYYTVTISGSITKDPDTFCSYKLELSVKTGPTKARVKPGSYKDLDCLPKKK